jgi:hypothetical protein
MIHVFHDMGQTCLILSSCRPDVQSALNSGPVDQHSHVLKTDHNYASWLKLIEEDNKQVVLFQAPTWLPQADTNKNTSLLPLSIPRALILCCGEETGSRAGTSMDSEGGSHDPLSVNKVTRILPDNRKCCRRFQHKASRWNSIWPPHWEIA